MKRLVCTTLAAGAVLALAQPAGAAPSGDSTVTFQVESGLLVLNAPSTADLGTGGPGSDISGQLGTTTVTDERASADASWVAAVTASDFSTGGGTPSETVLASEVDYWSGPATATTGTGTFTPGQPTALTAEPLDSVTPLSSFTHTGGVGNNTASWNPTLTVNVPLDSQAGLYTGTILQSVA